MAESARADEDHQGRVPHVVIVVGEPSGDALGAQLMAALRDLTEGRVRITGVGGAAMAAEGLTSLFSISDTAVMGLREVLPAVPRILRRVREAAEYIVEARPDILVLIDSPDFTHRIAKKVGPLLPDLPIVKYAAPQVWASRPQRAAKLAKIADCVLTLLPFEPPLFTKEGMRAEFVGHPVVERAPLITGGPGLRDRLAIAPSAPLLVVLPGSRANEVRFVLPAFRETVRLLKERIPDLQTAIPVVPHVAEKIETETADWPAPLHLLEQSDKFAAFDAADAALACSGTVTAELALAKVPMVVAYKAGWLTAIWAKSVVIAPFATLINVVEERGVIPEFLQEAVEPPVMADELARLMTDTDAAAVQTAALESALAKMGLGQESASQRAARVVLSLIGNPDAVRRHTAAPV